MSVSFRCFAVAVLSAVVILAVLSCGRSHSSGARDGTRVGAQAALPASGSRTAPKTVSLDAVLAQIDAYPAPKGVSAQTWTMLTAELKKLLVARSRDGKTLSIEPTGNLCKVTDLAAVSNPAGTQATVTWTEALAGDCNNDGEVGIADLQPIAAHYGESSSGPGSAAYLADADESGEVGITDLQPIAADYSMHIEGYEVWRGHYNGASTDWEATFRPNVGNPSNTSFSADRPFPPPVSTRPAYTYLDDISTLADKTNVRYKVTAYGDGAAGVESNEAIMPPPVPTGHNVSGTVLESGVGLAGVLMTLTPGGLNATTQADGTYSIPGVADGSYTLTPTLSGYTFTPAVRSVNVSGADVTGQDFAATLVPVTHAVSGTVTESGVGLAGVLMTLTPGGLNATTQADGTYSIPGVADGSYTLVPSKNGYVFTPVSRPVTVAGANVIGKDFTALQSGLANSAWPKFHANQFNTGLSPYVGAQTNALKWSHATGDWVFSSPAIAVDGTVYVGSSDYNVYALNPADGSVKWQHATGGAVDSSPAVGADGTVYVGSGDGNAYALNPSDGSVKWAHLTGGEVYDAPSVAPDGTIYVASYGDFHVYALNPADGSVKWSYATGGGVYSSPAIGADGTVYVGSDDYKVYALNPADGSVKWQHATGGAVDSSPAVGADGTVYVGSLAPDNTVYALNPADGSVKWSHLTGNGIGSSPAVGADGTVYVGSDDKYVYALNPTDGSLKWAFPTGGPVESSPAIGADGTVYVGSADHKVYALNPADGSVKWSYATGGSVFSSPAIGADGTVYIGSNDTKLYAFGAGGLATWSISGHVNYTVAPLDGVTVTVIPGGQFATTDLSGNYEIEGVPDGDYTLEPTKASYVFTPPSRPVTVAGANVIGQNFSSAIGPANSAWPKFHHDWFNSGQSDVVGPQTNTLVWQKLMAAPSISSPAIAADGTIYVGCDTGPVYAFNPSDGSEKWSQNTGGIVSGTPAVGADGKVYIGSENGNLLSLSPIDGSVNWTFVAGGGIAFFGGPTVGPDGTVYFGSVDKSIYAIDPMTGTQKWQRATGGEIHGCPAIGADGTIYVGSIDGKVYALNPLDGTVKWTHATGGAVYSSPSVGWDGTIFVGVWDAKKLLALNPADGSEKWSYSTPSMVDSSPAWSSDGIVYFGCTDGIVYALFGTDGTLKWTFTTSSAIESSPAIGADGTIYFGSYDSNVYAVNPDGTEKWHYTTGNQVLSSPALATNRLYIASRDTSLYAIGP